MQIVIWLDNDTLQTGLHANFKMASAGEGLYFSNASLNVINAVELPLLESSITYGRYPNGTGPFITMCPSYNAENSYTYLSFDNTDVFDNNVLVNVFLSPTINNITVSLGGKLELEFNVYSLSGQLMLNDKVMGTKFLSLQGWESGVSLLVIPDLDKTIKFIKK
jgi:hypothetical protein